MHMFPTRDASEDGLRIAQTCHLGGSALLVFALGWPFLGLNSEQALNILLTAMCMLACLYIVGHFLMETERLFGIPYGDGPDSGLASCWMETGTQTVFGLLMFLFLAQGIGLAQ